MMSSASAAAVAGGAAIRALGLQRAYGAVQAVDGVSLAVRPGEAYGLLGPDGAGKTTFIRLLVGALRPDAGRAVISGFDVATDSEAARATIGYLAGRFSLYGDLTVVENLRFFGQVRGLGGSELNSRARELLGFVGLNGFEVWRAEQLSGGMKQKLGLASALINQPQVLLLDEPTTGVDPVTRQDFWRLIIPLLAHGDLAVLVSTPYMDEAARCGRIGLLRAGRLVAEGRPGDLTAPLIGRVLELSAGPRRVVQQVAAADPDVREVLAFGDRFHLLVSDAEGPLARLPQALRAAGAQVERLRSIAPSLEDAFISLYSEAPSVSSPEAAARHG